MSIKIHHGPNGSYKTSGAIQDDAVPALKEGRLIITNVRGFTLDRVLQAYPDLPDTVDIINLDLESLDDMERMRTWFQWAPRGAFIIFDETQLVFPKSWRDKDLERFDFPGGPEAAKAADRPMNWLDGWTRHRHWNWDIVLTTPNVSYIRDDIRMTSETAYKHSNMAVIGLKGRYKEAQHDAQLNRPPQDGTIVEYRKINPDTFKLYLSTSTGKTQDTRAGKSMFKSPRILLLLALLAGSIGYIFVGGGATVLTDGVGSAGRQAAHSEAVPQSAPVAPKADPAPASGVSLPTLGDKPADVVAVQLDHPFAPRTFAIRAVMVDEREGKRRQIGQFDVVDAQGLIVRQSLADLQHLGYQIHIRGQCVVDISHPMGFKSTVLCTGKPAQREEPQRQLAAAPSAFSAPVSTGSKTANVTVVSDGDYASKPWR